jgi:hypothetical protein
MSYASVVLADSPEAFWQMNESSGFPQDSSGNGNHMTSVSAGGAVYSEPGPFGGAPSIKLPGGVNFQKGSPVTTVVNNFSLEMFFLFSDAVDNDRILYNGDLDSDPGWGIDYQLSGSKIRALYGGVAWETESTASVDDAPDPLWHHIVSVRDAGTTKYYFDGALDTANAGVDAPNAPATNCFIGSTSAVTGWYSMCAIYDTVLSAGQVLAHFEASEDWGLFYHRA